MKYGFIAVLLIPPALLRMLDKGILQGSGSVSRKQAFAKAEKEFERYRQHEMRQLESDFDRAIKALLDKEGGGNNG